MIKYFTDILSQFDIAGVGMFGYLSFRASMALIASLLISTVFGRKIIDLLRKKQIGEQIRELGLEGQAAKKGTPTMGGIIILVSLLVPVILFCDLSNTYIILMIVASVWLGLLGFLDDYMKVHLKNKDGLSGRYKILGQIGLGLIVGITMWQSEQIMVKQKYSEGMNSSTSVSVSSYNRGKDSVSLVMNVEKMPITTIPFVKNSEFNYKNLIPFDNVEDIWGWLLYVVIAVFIITAVSNGANLTDGLDGLAAGTSAIVVVVLAIFAYVSGNVIYSDYLNLLYIPYSGELFVFCAAFAGALIGFLWYNSYPAQVFMGDTGSLAIGGIIAVVSLLVRKELLLPILCGVFLVEVGSVMLQVGYFKHTKKRFGEGKRLFLMAPLHHHYQKKGFSEVKIVTRFWIVQLLLAAITLATIKIR